jgi:phospholipase/carboxylesterase
LFIVGTNCDSSVVSLRLRGLRPLRGLASCPTARRGLYILGQAEAALDDLARWLEAAPARLGTEPGRTYLLGFSQGAMMSLGILGTHPERLAGVVMLSGRAPRDLFPARASREAISAVPLLVAHGTHDDVIPIERGREVGDAFRSLSRDFTYREFPIGHGIGDEELSLVTAWLRERLGPG